MPIYKDPKELKKQLHKMSLSFKRFNEWERRLNDKPDVTTCLAAVFELYEMIPPQARTRTINVEGIMKMREGIACLT
jgi:hypothetical protein